MEIVYVYQRKRKEFGKQTVFRDVQPSDLTWSISPDPVQAKNFEERSHCTVEVQVMPEQSEHEVKVQEHP